MEYVKLRSFNEYREYQKLHRKERIDMEEQLVKDFVENKNDLIIGFCNVCEKSARFKLHVNKMGKINLRGTLACEYCKLTNRKRFMLSFLKDFVKKSNSRFTIYSRLHSRNSQKYRQNIGCSTRC